MSDVQIPSLADAAERYAAYALQAGVARQAGCRCCCGWTVLLYPVPLELQLMHGLPEDSLLLLISDHQQNTSRLTVYEAGKHGTNQLAAIHWGLLVYQATATRELWGCRADA